MANLTKPALTKAAGALAALCILSMGAPLLAQDAERNQLLDAVVGHYAALQKLPGLEVEYKMTRDILQPSSSELWAWRWGEFTHAIRPSTTTKVYSRAVLPPYDEDLKADAATEAIATLDNGIWVDLNRDLSSDRSSGMITTVEKHPVFSKVVMHCYYFRFLGLPVSHDPENGVAPRSAFPKGAYWLPDALSQNRKDYVLRDAKATAGGEPCRVLERPGVDAIWVDEKTQRVLRRQFYWEAAKTIRQDVQFADFQEVAGSKLALPRLIVFEQHAAPWDEAAIRGKVVGRLTLRVSRMSAQPLPDERFRPTIPTGAVVLDYLHSGSDTKHGIVYTNKPGNDPFEDSLLRLIDRPSTYGWVFVVIFLALLIFVCFRLYYKKIKGYLARKP